MCMEQDTLKAPRDFPFNTRAAAFARLHVARTRRSPDRARRPRRVATRRLGRLGRDPRHRCADVTIKVELHTHTSADPVDRILHDAGRLIDRASRLGYGALAVTLHDRWHDPAPWHDRALARGVTLIPAIERTIEGAHVLLINVPREAEHVRTFDDLRAFKASTNALVVAPHPFYPIPSAMGSRLEKHGDLFDALEISSLHARGIDFNRRASSGPPRTGSPSSAIRTSTCWRNWGRLTRWWMPRPPRPTRFARPYGWDECR